MRVRVLVVDDLQFMRELLCGILSDAGADVVAEAEDGRAALRRFLVHEPDVVLLDIAMPVMDGITTLRKIRMLEPRARVIMCSALGEQQLIVRAIQLGARDFVVKPFTPQRVVSAISKVLAADRVERDALRVPA
ncbi:MAG: response regulator [Spirochaetaceae bacterium]|nr:MAG: response regulator [Spirochaetaceae bacterium]